MMNVFKIIFTAQKIKILIYFQIININFQKNNKNMNFKNQI